MTAKSEKPVGWEIAYDKGAVGTGNWKWFPHEELPRVYEAAEHWKKALEGVERPWLCWCIDDEWNWYQQRLVARCGWTPIVGTDGRVARPRLLPESLFVDFNEHLKYPVMWMHFPLEFVHHFCPRLAFWHSDLLPPLSILQQVADQFDAIAPGGVIAVDGTRPGLLQMYKRFRKGCQITYKRYFELAGCTTADASRSQFEHGCGWWKHINHHVNFDAARYKRRPHFDNGVGIWFWQTLYGGNVQKIQKNLNPYHYSTNHRNYRRLRDKAGRPIDSKHAELKRSFDLEKIVSQLELD